MLQLGSLQVYAPPGAIASGQTLTLTAGSQPGFEPPAPSIGDGPYTLSTSQGEPSMPVTVSLHYDPAALGDGGHPLVLHGLDGWDTWVPEATTVDAAQAVASAVLDSFSPVDIANSVVYYGGLITGNRSDTPDGCQMDPPSWVQDISLPCSQQQPLPISFRTDPHDGSTATLHLVNNRGYPQMVTVGGIDFDLEKAEWSDSLEGQAALAFAAAIPSGSPQAFILAPGGSARLVIHKPPDQPAPQPVYIDPQPTARVTALAALGWSLLATAKKQIGIPQDVADCVIASVYNVSSGDRGVATAIDQIHHCGNVATEGLSEAGRKLFQKLALGLVVDDFFYKLQDLMADTAYPPQIGFTVRGTGLVDTDIHVGPYYLGKIAPGQPYVLQLKASGGTGPYAFHLYQGDVNGNHPPAWASVSASGLLTLNPPADDNAAYLFYVYVFDHTGRHSPFARDVVKVATGDEEAPFTDRPHVSFPNVPEGLWTVPMPNGGQIVPRPDGSITTTPCSYHSPDDADAPFRLQQVTGDGGMQWRRPGENAVCGTLITDASGNSYYFMSDALGAHIRSVDHRGQVRWTSAVLPHQIDRAGYGRPTLGADGNVYFTLYDGWGHGYLTGLDEQTGAITMDRSAGFPLALSAYDEGLVIVDGYDHVEYVAYDGRQLADYPVANIDFPSLGTVGAGPDGTVFVAAGAPGACGPTTSNSFSVAKVTPAGVAWTWTDAGSTGCERGSTAATPNGGVVVTESADRTDGHVTMLGADRTVLWRTTVSADVKLGALAAGPALVDVGGVVAIPTYDSYACNSNPADTCTRLHVSFADQDSSATRLPRITATIESHGQDTNQNSWGDIAIAPDRVFVAASPLLDYNTYGTDTYGLSAIAAPGLGQNFAQARELSVGSPP